MTLEKVRKRKRIKEHHDGRESQTEKNELVSKVGLWPSKSYG